MLFLMNDAVLNLGGDDLSPHLLAMRFGAIGFDCVQSLGQEMFSEQPTAQHSKPDQAKKLAALIHCKQPTINAALFVAPSKGCKPDRVGVRFAAVDMTVMGSLYRAQVDGNLDAVFADNQVWRRVAAA